MRTWLAFFWLSLIVVCGSLAVIMLGLYRHGAGIQIQQGEKAAYDACALLRDQYANYLDAHPQETRINLDLLNVLLQLILRDVPGIEGGVWSQTDGFIAYAYPTYEGSGVKRDVPEAERPRLSALAEQSVRNQSAGQEVQTGEREALIVATCPLRSAGFAAWTMKRVSAGLGAAYDRLALGLVVLLSFVLISGLWLGWVLYRWSHHLRRFETVLRSHAIDALPELAVTGEPDLDRIVASLNEFGRRLKTAHEQSEGLARQLARNDRMAALGRMTAAVAHEIRNPIAAMRLKAENALTQPEQRLPQALQAILLQIERLEKLLQGMLAMAQPFSLTLQRVDLADWLAERVVALGEQSVAAQVKIAAKANTSEWVFDPIYAARALENLLLNSLQHTPPGGEINVLIGSDNERLIISVSDTGGGVAHEVREHLFEPFVTSRTGGSGLGLALVREIAIAHGGHVDYTETSHGARFELELPWRNVDAATRGGEATSRVAR